MVWIKLGLIIVVFSIIISIVKLILRKIFKIEKTKKEFFSYNYINDVHRKIDKWIKNITAITLAVLIFVQLSFYDEYTYLFPVGSVIFFVLGSAVRVFFEWKHSANPKQAILTITEMFLGAIAMILVIQYILHGSFS